MREELIVSGRMNPHIDPQLHIWEWEIPLYLFLGGLAAGLMFFAALYYIQKKESVYETAVKKAPVIIPFALIIGLLALFADLNHKLYFWRLYTTIKFQSPMSWGAWVLMVATPLSFIWVALHIKTFFPKWDWKYKFLFILEDFFNKYKLQLAWLMLICSLVLGMYTGILFSAFNARPLWNTSILGPLFLTSGLSTGAATIMLISKSVQERRLFAKIDLILIGIEIFLIIHMFMGFLAGTQTQLDAVALFLGGPYTAVFWVFVVMLGMVIPAILEIMELQNKHIPVLIPSVLVLMGGIILRFILAYAGQVSRWLY